MLPRRRVLEPDDLRGGRQALYRVRLGRCFIQADSNTEGVEKGLRCGCSSVQGGPYAIRHSGVSDRHVKHSVIRASTGIRKL